MKRIDIFPAIIKLSPEGSVENLEEFDFASTPPKGTRKLDRCRAVVLNETLMIVVDSPTGPTLVFREKVTEQFHDKNVTKLRTQSNKVVIIKKDDNCGCGSRLRGWSPYGNIATSSFDPVD
jgi:hypothetical protein